MEIHSLGSIPVQSTASIKRTVLNYGVFQFRVVSQNVPVELTMPHYLYSVHDTG